MIEKLKIKIIKERLTRLFIKLYNIWNKGKTSRINWCQINWTARILKESKIEGSNRHGLYIEKHDY